MRINYDLLSIKLHYFFIFAATAPMLPYLPPYMHQNLNISYNGIGLIYTCLPFFGLITKAVSGAISDRFHIHRSIFISSLIVCGLGFFSIYFSPPVTKFENKIPAQIQLDCSKVHTYFRHSDPKNGQCQNFNLKKTSAGFSNCQVECPISYNTEFSNLCSSWNLKNCPADKLMFNATASLNHTVDDEVEFFVPLNEILVQDTQILNPTCEKVIRLNCSVHCDDADLMSAWGISTYVFLESYSSLLSEYGFWIIFLCITLAWSGLAIAVVMSDTACFYVLGPRADKFGHQRLWGSIGWAIVVLFSGYLIDMTSESADNKNYSSAFFLALVLFSVDALIATKVKIGDKSAEKSDLRSVLKLMTDVRIVVFILCCVVVGISTGILWTYQLLLVEEVVNEWDCNFQYMKLLQGIIIAVSAFGGELPFFFISGYFIKKLGHVHAMSLVIAAFGLRFILYYAVSNPWWFLPIEMLNGFTFGIFYAVMTSYANIVAPSGSHATMQGIVGSSFEGLGVASGSFIGGDLFNKVGGSYTYLYIGILNVCFALFHIIVQLGLNEYCPKVPRSDGYTTTERAGSNDPIEVSRGSEDLVDDDASVPNNLNMS